MEQEVKYYTPDISEFYIGFEFEIIGDSSVGWTKQVVDLDTLEYIDSVFHTKTRVKYLDKEDIEELGWEQSDYYENTYFLKKEKLTYKLDKSFSIYYIQEYLNNSHTTRIFAGTIKNKSELKKLMQMLNIIK